MIVDFFKGLVRSRVSGVKALAKGKAYGIQAKAKGKASAKFNGAIDGSVKKAKGVATGKGKKPAAKKKDKGKEKNMGFFGKKKDAPPQQQQAEGFDDEPMHTVAISLDQVQQGAGREVVGWVVVMGGEQKGTDFRLFPGRNVMGTAADCDIVLTDAYLSSKHCAIRYEDEQYSMVDLDSTNGTMVNGKKTAKVELIDNDMIRLGKTELKFKSLY